MVKDSRGQIPNFVIANGYLIHQPTGNKIKLNSRDALAIRRAQNALMAKVRRKTE